MTGFHHFTKGDPDAPAVLCLHGLLGSSRNLYRVAESIAAAGFFAVAYDQRGHGHSPHYDNYSLEAMAGDVFAMMDALSITSAHLVGHSMGGRVALAATGMHPDRVRSLCMLDSGMTIRPQTFEGLRAIVDTLAPSFPSREAADEAFRHHPAAFRQFLIANLRTQPRPPNELTWIFDLAGIRDKLLNEIPVDQTETWKNVRCPALIARGELSDTLPEQDFQDMLAVNPRARGIVIPHAGHWLHVDNFSATVEAVTQFLRMEP